jgi:haloalkane dehalogenase
MDALDLQDITMVVHDVGGPLGFLIAIRRPERFRALVISNTFAWPLADYPGIRRLLEIIANPLVGLANSLTNALAIATATSYGVGRHMTKADRKSFLGPWRSRAERRATQQVLAGVLRIDPLMAGIEHELASKLGDVPVLTLFGRKNDPYDWQDRFGHLLRNVTAVGIEDGRHFPFNDDPDAYSAALRRWWSEKVVSR